MILEIKVFKKLKILQIFFSQKPLCAQFTIDSGELMWTPLNYSLWLSIRFWSTKSTLRSEKKLDNVHILSKYSSMT